MGSMSIVHWLIVLGIVALIFGTKKLRNMGEDLGGAIKGFKKGMRDASDEEEPINKLASPADDPNTIDVKAQQKAD